MMGHSCRIEGSSTACFEHSGELWVKEYGDGRQKEGRTYKVNFCPECGFKLPARKSLMRFFTSIPSSEPDETISKFSMELGKAIAEMNHNVTAIKTFMIAQNTQNECFLSNEMDLRKRITQLESKKTFTAYVEGLYTFTWFDSEGIENTCLNVPLKKGQEWSFPPGYRTPFSGSLQQ